MSSFVIFPKNAKKEQRLLSFIKRYTGNILCQDVGGAYDHRILLWSGKTKSTAFLETMGGDDFIAVAGSFFYGPSTGRVAARSFWQDFDENTFDWSQCTGTFAIALFKKGRLFILNDGISAWRLYGDSSGKVMSAGFMEVLLLQDTPRFNPQGVYEYAFTGFPKGTTTFVKNIDAALPNQLLTLEPSGRFSHKALPSPMKPARSTGRPLAEVANNQMTILEDRFKNYRCLDSKDVSSSLSGGIDSRLMVQNFVNQGIRPDLFVYGPDDDPDVISAKAVAGYLGLSLNHVKKSEVAKVQASAEDLLFYFDCWREDGIMGHLADLPDRLRRADVAPYMANGKSGEIYRHYYYYKVPRRGVTLDAVNKATCARYIPAIVTQQFDKHAYRDTIKSWLRALLGVEGDRLSADDFELLYPKVRLCHENSRDIVINHRFHHALYPFYEPTLCGPAAALTYEERIYGRMEAAMIASRDPELARVENAYGYDLMDGPNLKQRLSSAASYRRPLWVRPLIPGLQTWLSKGVGFDQLIGDHMALLKDQEMPLMQSYFRLDKVSTKEVASRIATMELVGQTFAFS